MHHLFFDYEAPKNPTRVKLSRASNLSRKLKVTVTGRKMGRPQKAISGKPQGTQSARIHLLKTLAQGNNMVKGVDQQEVSCLLMVLCDVPFLSCKMFVF